MCCSADVLRCCCFAVLRCCRAAVLPLLPLMYVLPSFRVDVSPLRLDITLLLQYCSTFALQYLISKSLPGVGIA